MSTSSQSYPDCTNTLGAMPAVILAGGRGTRLQSVVADRPKALAEVADRPFLAYVLDQLAESGIAQVLLLTGYKAEQIERLFGERYRGMSLCYSRESQPLGTAGAVRAAAGMIAAPEFLLLNGDSYCDVDLAALAEYHRESNADLTMLLARVEDGRRFGSVEMNAAGMIMEFVEKQDSDGPRWINAGIYLIRTELVHDIPQGRAMSLEKEMLPGWIRKKRIAGFTCGEVLLDIGTPESYLSAEAFFHIYA